MFRLLQNVLAALFGRHSAPRFGRLADERKGELFTWFNLEERAAPTAMGAGRTRHSFHPSGPDFQELVTLDLEVAGDDEIVGAALALDRDFIDDPRNSPFARDIAKSFLIWALRHEPSQHAQPLIDNIANLGAAGAVVLVRASAAPPAPPEDATGGYAVFLGRRVAAELTLDRTRATLRNTANGRRWLALSVMSKQ